MASIAPTGTITPYEMRQCDSSDVPFQDISEYIKCLK